MSIQEVISGLFLTLKSLTHMTPELADACTRRPKHLLRRHFYRIRVSINCGTRVIAELAAARAAEVSVVATSDRGLRARLDAHGVRTIGGGTFLRDLRAQGARGEGESSGRRSRTTRHSCAGPGTASAASPPTPPRPGRRG